MMLRTITVPNEEIETQLYLLFCPGLQYSY